MKKLLILTVLTAMFAVSLAACGGNEPVSIADTRATREAEATTAAQEIEVAEQERIDLIARIAPEGTDIAAVEPSRQHDESVNYPFEGLPASGGVHHPQWQKCDVYERPVPEEHAIHAMEHGGVWITYNPDDVSDADISNLEGFTRGEPFVLVSPYPNQDAPIAITAWGLQLTVDQSDDARLREFIDAFANGPQTPEPGANCAGGVGTMEDA